MIEVINFTKRYGDFLAEKKRFKDAAGAYAKAAALEPGAKNQTSAASTQAAAT